MNFGKGKAAVRRETKTAAFLNKPQRHYSRKDAKMQSNNFPKRRYYTEADAKARADEIVAERLAEIIDKCDRMLQGFLSANETNSRLNRELRIAQESAEKMTRAAICYEETYNRLPEEMQEEFKRINSEVMKEYGI